MEKKFPKDHCCLAKNGLDDSERIVDMLLSSQESNDLLKIVEARVDSARGSMLFCIQYETDDWYGRIDPVCTEGNLISKRSWTGSSTIPTMFLSQEGIHA